MTRTVVGESNRSGSFVLEQVEQRCKKMRPAANHATYDTFATLCVAMTTTPDTRLKESSGVDQTVVAGNPLSGRVHPAGSR
jgi:hypothetical protein